METVVAVAIVGAIAAGFLTALDMNFRATRSLDEKVTAANLATAYLEAIKASTYDASDPFYPDAVAGITIPIQYSVDIDVACSSDGTSFSACTGSETFQRITVTVSREEGKQILSVCTYRSKR